MDIKPEELQQKNYVLLETLEHTELVPFVKTYLQKNTLYSKSYYLSLMLFFAMLLFYSVKYQQSGLLIIPNILSQLSFGILLTLALIPIHEIIHAIVYKLLGAKQTSFDADLKKFIFMAVADQFVADKKELRMVALAPFTVISAVLIMVFLSATTQTSIMILTVLLTHATICSGDFALCSYFSFHKAKVIVTYDDRESKVSYFYENVTGFTTSANC